MTKRASISYNTTEAAYESSAVPNYETTNVEINRPLVLCGPSGVGKGTQKMMQLKNFPDVFVSKISHTTRKPREYEIDGIDYHFITREQFIKDIDDGKFLEYTETHNNLYGTQISELMRIINTKRIPLLELDIFGVQNIYNIWSKNPNEILYNTINIWIQPPSFDELKQRLQSRGTETAYTMKSRLMTAENEISSFNSNSSLFHTILTNNDLDQCYRSLLHKVSIFYPHIALFIE